MYPLNDESLLQVEALPVEGVHDGNRGAADGVAALADRGLDPEGPAVGERDFDLVGLPERPEDRDVLDDPFLARLRVDRPDEIEAGRRDILARLGKRGPDFELSALGSHEVVEGLLGEVNVAGTRFNDEFKFHWCFPPLRIIPLFLPFSPRRKRLGGLPLPGPSLDYP